MVKQALIALVLSLNFVWAQDFYPAQDIVNFIKLTPQEQVKELDRLGIKVLKFQDSQKSPSRAKIIPYLNYLSPEEASQFNQYIDEDVLGIFFTKHNSYYHVDTDTIIISEQADDWTLYHELSHALIDRHRHKLNPYEEGITFMTLEDALEDYEESMSYFRMFGQFSSEAATIYSYESLKTWIKTSLEMLNTYELEEVKIESNLREIYKQLDLTISDLDRSLRYAQANCDSAQRKVTHAQEVYDYFLTFNKIEVVLKNQDDIKDFKNYLSSKKSLVDQKCN